MQNLSGTTLKYFFLEVLCLILNLFNRVNEKNLEVMQIDYNAVLYICHLTWFRSINFYCKHIVIHVEALERLSSAKPSSLMLLMIGGLMSGME